MWSATGGQQLRPMAGDSLAAVGVKLLPGASDPGVGTHPPRSACPKRLSVASAACEPLVASCCAVGANSWAALQAIPALPGPAGGWRQAGRPVLGALVCSRLAGYWPSRS
jgi:hypothetical protein